MAIELYYHILSPLARSVASLAKHLGLEVNIKELNMMAGEHKNPEFLKLNPAHAIPVIVDNGFVLTESRAILQYLANKYASDKSIYPEEAQARAIIDKVLFFDGCELWPAFKTAWLSKLKDKVDPSKEIMDNLTEKMNLLDIMLGDQKFFGGDKTTIADISVAALIPNFKFLFPDLITPRMHEWYDRVAREMPELKELNDTVDYEIFLK